MKISNGKYFLLVFTLLAFIFSATSLSAQIAVRGTITEKGTGLPAAYINVVVRGTITGTLTAEDGTYSLPSVAPNAVLEIKAIGYKSLEVNVGGRAVIDAEIETDNLQLEQVVTVGFATQKRANLTGAVETIDTKALESRPVANLNAAIQGLSPALSLYWTSGQLNAEPTIRLRGFGTISRNSSGGNAQAAGGPLILIDGVPGTLSTINPDDVEEISILKDAASSAIYGARAAFGVVLITTKRGQNNDRLRYSYNFSMGWSNPTQMLSHMDPLLENYYMVGQAKRNGDNAPESWGLYYEDQLPGLERWVAKWGNPFTGKSKRDTFDDNMVLGDDFEFLGRTPYFYRIWEPNKYMFGKNVATMNHSFQMSGRVGQNSTLMASFGYNNREGVLRINPEDMKRYTLTVNLSTPLAKWLQADIRTTISRQNYAQPFNYMSTGFTANMDGYVGEMYRYGAYAPYGLYEGVGWGWGPGLLRAAQYSNRISDNLRVQGVLTAVITPELNIRAEYSISQGYTTNKQNGGNVALWKHQAGTNAVDGKPDLMYNDEAAATRVSLQMNNQHTEVFNLYSTYQKRFGSDHNFTAQLGLNSEWRENMSVEGTKATLLDPTKAEFDLAVGPMTADGSHTWGSLIGFFGRITYDYKGKYLFELNGRYDGTSKFPTGSKWGFFPSWSAGWRISEEPFLKGNKVLNNLKLRVSIGTIGNEDVTNSLYEPTMTSSNASWLANGLTNQGPVTYGNPRSVASALSWEKVTGYNLGLDIGLWSMLSISGEIYQRNTFGMLSQGKTLPQNFGATAAFINAGDLRARGWEVTVSFNKMINRDFSVSAAATLSDAVQKITKWESEGSLSSFYEGQIFGEIWGLTTDRLFQVSDFTNGVMNPGFPDQTPLEKSVFKFGPGDVLYKDLNGDGKIDTGAGRIDDHGDLSIIGNSTPRYEYSARLGANYKGFELSVFFQGVGKRAMESTNSDVILPLQRGYPDLLYAHQEDHWREDNPNGFYPRLWRYRGATIPGVYGSNNSITQTRYLLNLAYLRLKNITLGYNVPRNVVNKVKLDRLYVYLSAENLFTWQDTNVPMDPEVTRSSSMLGRGFPMQKTVSIGARVSF